MKKIKHSGRGLNLRNLSFRFSCSVQLKFLFFLLVSYKYKDFFLCHFYSEFLSNYFTLINVNVNFIKIIPVGNRV